MDSVVSFIQNAISIVIIAALFIAPVILLIVGINSFRKLLTELKEQKLRDEQEAAEKEVRLTALKEETSGDESDELHGNDPEDE